MIIGVNPRGLQRPGPQYLAWGVPSIKMSPIIQLLLKTGSMSFLSPPTTTIVLVILCFAVIITAASGRQYTVIFTWSWIVNITAVPTDLCVIYNSWTLAAVAAAKLLIVVFLKQTILYIWPVTRNLRWSLRAYSSRILYSRVLKMYEIVQWLGFRPGPHWGANSALHAPSWCGRGWLPPPPKNSNRSCPCRPQASALRASWKRIRIAYHSHIIQTT